VILRSPWIAALSSDKSVLGTIKSLMSSVELSTLFRKLAKHYPIRVVLMNHFFYRTDYGSFQFCHFVNYVNDCLDISNPSV